MTMNNFFLNKFDNCIYNKKYFCYIITGSEFFFIRRSIDILFRKLNKLEYIKCNSIIIDINIDWSYIFSKFSTMDFFCKKQFIHLIILDKKILLKYQSKLMYLTKLVRNTNILILEINNETNQNIDNIIKNIINNNDYIFLKKYNKLSNTNLANWIKYRVQQLNLLIDNNILDLLQYFCSGNLNFLNQILTSFSLKEKDNHVTVDMIFSFINNTKYIKNNDLISSILSGNIQNSINIINKIKYMQENPYIILNKLQKSIILLLKIYRSIKKYSIEIVFKKFFIISITKQNLFKIILKRINSHKLYLLIKLLLEIEIKIKSFQTNNYIEKYFWIDLEKLVFLFL
ncbi:DNA polymerase III subunit delta [Enterobacteriaceae endosymbiont of Donacia tomentosa]|uniref:DNA polymerase III subunit delta n=1 Tax=Enterobacteriaceae endosymbiont of Donacia tomentosa TaxID=2675787 RepID=UPI0014492665|nr:DNA polymerase III subunit delta [Enterobacteriaceae endosymbiont of Donacia tomentosa]QJC31729.1 DNA polymerase III subunit delta [Enterobacteriaceae endosymbiont of Donacia tomentosa]